MLFVYRPWRMTRVADHVNHTIAPCRRSGPRPIRSSSPGRLGCVPRERGRRQLRRINHLRPPFALDELPPPPSCCLFVEPSLSRSACGLITSVPFRSVPFRSVPFSSVTRTSLRLGCRSRLRGQALAPRPSPLEHPSPTARRIRDLRCRRSHLSGSGQKTYQYWQLNRYPTLLWNAIQRMTATFSCNLLQSRSTSNLAQDRRTDELRHPLARTRRSERRLEQTAKPARDSSWPMPTDWKHAGIAPNTYYLA